MASICAQFSAHFPILDNGEGLRFSSRYPHDFAVDNCWDGVFKEGLKDDFNASYEPMRLPLHQRISVADPAKPNTFLIDGAIELTIPTQSTVDKAVEFWAGRENVAMWSSAVFGTAALALFLSAKPIAALIATSMPILGVIYAVASACLIVVGAVFAGFNYWSYVEAGEELDGWQQIQVHVPYLATFPEKIATIRKRIFEAYRDGNAVVDRQRHLLRNRFLTPQEERILLNKGVQIAFPHLSAQEQQMNLIEISGRHSIPWVPDQRPLWDYVFPDLLFSDIYCTYNAYRGHA